MSGRLQLSFNAYYSMLSIIHNKNLFANIKVALILFDIEIDIE